MAKRAAQGEEVAVAVFASGAGSNFRRLYELGAAGNLGCGRVVLLISDQPDCGAVAYARAMGVPVWSETQRALGGKDAWETQALARLREANVALVVLAGYMRIVGHTLLQGYEGRMINVHPSWLPEFPGLDAVGQALAAGVSQTGVTVHYVDAGLDSGPILAQERVPMVAGETKEQLLLRVHRLEHELLPRVVAAWCDEYATQSNRGRKDDGESTD